MSKSEYDAGGWLAQPVMVEAQTAQRILTREQWAHIEDNPPRS